MLAPSNEPRDDLWYATLLALMRVGHQALHVRLQQRNKGVVEITEQSLEEWGKSSFIFIFPTYGIFRISTTPTNLTLNKQNLRGLNLSFPLRSSKERNSMNWLMNTGSEKWSKMIFSRCRDENGNIISIWMLFHLTVVNGQAPLSFPLWSNSVWAGPPGVRTLAVF